MKICSQCKLPYDEEKQEVVLYERKSIIQIYNFCSGICNMIFNLETCHDMLFTTGLDQSWMPVIRNLHDELEKSINKSINKIGESSV